MSEYQPTVDQEATNKFGEIFDQLLTENPDVLKTAKGRHALNVFFTQLLFCFFAEDTGIFTENQFTNAVGSRTTDDGSAIRRLPRRALHRTRHRGPRRESRERVRSIPEQQPTILGQSSNPPYQRKES